MLTIFLSSLLILSNGKELIQGRHSCGIVCQMFHILYDLTADVCNNNEMIVLSSSTYYLNNLWGASTAKPGYCECLAGTTVSYTWASVSPGSKSVKAYPAIITGWHWGYALGQGSANLPVIINSIPTIMVNWTVHHSDPGGSEWYDTAFDIWLGGINELDPNQPSAEIMIWMNHVNQSPLGVYIETITVWNSSFDVYAYFAISPAWSTFSFVQQQHTWSFNNVNLFPFFDYLWNTKKWIDGNQYICGIEAGNEIVYGQGTFTHNYSLKVN